MSFLRHGKIYQSDEPKGGGAHRSTSLATIVPMSLQPAIPSWGALQQSPCPLRRSFTASLSTLLLYSLRQRTVTCPHFPCLNSGVHSNYTPRLSPYSPPIPLDAEFYDQAIVAHRTKRLVSCSGELVRLGRLILLKNLTSFQVAPEYDPEKPGPLYADQRGIGQQLSRRSSAPNSDRSFDGSLGPDETITVTRTTQCSKGVDGAERS